MDRIHYSRWRRHNACSPDEDLDKVQTTVRECGREHSQASTKRNGVRYLGGARWIGLLSPNVDFKSRNRRFVEMHDRYFNRSSPQSSTLSSGNVPRTYATFCNTLQSPNPIRRIDARKIAVPHSHPIRRIDACSLFCSPPANVWKNIVARRSNPSDWCVLFFLQAS